MEKIYVKNLVLDTVVDSPFLLRQISIKQKRNGEDYLAMTLGDKTGEVEAVMWEGVAETRDGIGKGDYVQVTGRVGSFRERPQIVVTRAARLDPESVDESDFIPAASADLGELWRELTAAIESVADPHLQRLLQGVFAESDPAADGFRRAPAAKRNHHVYLGGLLEHTVSVVRLASALAELYPDMDRDILITGAVLHDIGKVTELAYDREFEYTVEGEMVGHIVMAAADLDRRMRELSFPDGLRVKVLHMIISHHGEEQYGSPRKPMTLEAIALHFIDMLDSRLEMAREALKQGEGDEGMFTDKVWSLENRRIFKG